MSTHRRSSSGSTAPSPSKLSNVTTISLTPTAESTEPASSASGFFSTVISAAQNAATTLSNTIPGAGSAQVGGKSRSALLKPQSLLTTTRAKTHPPAGVEPSAEPLADQVMDQEKSTPRTLGSGDLSLSQLGFSEPSSSIGSPNQSHPYDAAADVRVRSESAPVDPPSHANDALSEGHASRPRSLMEAPSGDRTPPLPELTDHKVGVLRNPSIRSAVKEPRKRGSSVTTGGTGTTVGATATALQSATTSPNATAGPPKLIGFAIASKKRNRDFHNLFKSVPDNDYLIEDYSCALQREILAHGRLYVSEGHLCFSSNILGWTTTLVMSFDEIVSVEKRSTALVFKNGLMISTLHAKHVFASFTSRDATYDLIINIWKLGHPTLKNTLNGVRLEGTGGDKTEKIDPELPGPEAEMRDDASGSVEDESEDDDDGEEGYSDEEQSLEPAEVQVKDAAGAEAGTESPAQRKASLSASANGAPADAAKEPSPSQSGAVDFPGPATHAPTDCGDSATHFEKVVGDDVISAPLGKVFNLVFGPASVTWMSKWLTGDQKCTDLQMEDRKGLSLDNRTRNYSYVKPLNASIGPKQTKCIVAETLENFDLEKAVNLNISTQNPDVPSGNVFSVKTKYCLSWAENNATRVQVNCTTEWTGKSWLKGPIEKGVADGQSQYCRDLFAALKAAVSSRPRVGAGANEAGKGKKKLKPAKALQSMDGSREGGRASKHDGARNWGVLEPVRALAEPLLDLLRPILGSHLLNGLLLGIIIAVWCGFGVLPGRNVPPFGVRSGFDGAHNLAAPEEMWRREDGELWEWLDERVGMELVGVHQPNPSVGRPKPETVDGPLRHAARQGGQMEEALRVTEEKLRVLKEVVGRTNNEHR